MKSCFMRCSGTTEVHFMGWDLQVSILEPGMNLACPTGRLDWFAGQRIGGVPWRLLGVFGANESHSDKQPCSHSKACAAMAHGRTQAEPLGRAKTPPPPQQSGISA